MSLFDDLDVNLMDRYFGTSTFDLRCEMRALSDARLLWFNRRAAERSSCLKRLEPKAREEFVLRSCAYLLADATTASDRSTSERAHAFADRYGGEGISIHGGSGRGVIIHGFHVKGVGRTGLLGLDSDPSHTSGGAYLEEAVREAIFSEICAMEYPAGAVPILAIIDTGDHVVWDTSEGPKRERKVLMVRPCIFRPAHLERALFYVSADRWCGAVDASRVAARAGVLYELLGADGVGQALTSWASSWAEQMAYAFVHRLPHAAHSTSNVTLSGAMLDFGGCTAVPSWARFLLLQNGDRFGLEFPRVIQALRSLVDNIEFATDLPPLSREVLVQANEQARRAFERRITLEVLRACGLCTDDALALLDAEDHDSLFNVAMSCFRDSQRELFELSRDPPTPRFGFDFASIYSSNCPAHLEALRCLVMDRLDPADVEAARARAALMGKPRMQLYREALKDRIYAAVETDLGAWDAQVERISSFISSEITAGRRDFGPLPREAIPVGFAAGPSLSATLVRMSGQRELSALIDWVDMDLCRALGDPAIKPAGPRRAVACIGIGSDFVKLAGAAVVRVPCAVALA